MANRNWTSIQITSNIIKLDHHDEETLSGVLKENWGSSIEDASKDMIGLNGKYSFPQEDVERIYKELIKRDEDLEMTVTCESEMFDYIVGGFGNKNGILFEERWPGNEEYVDAMEEEREEEYEKELQEWQVVLIDKCRKKLK
jgi:hypothetical protein